MTLTDKDKIKNAVRLIDKNLERYEEQRRASKIRHFY